mmetsp:Transcript_8200/g.13821  ORF Transcript_8200/g.13821 Transcript_8200/m.13821 type:complete len:112 (-) Transcript_8200:91-426(-)
MMMLVTEVHALLDHESIAVHESNEYCDLSDAVVDHSAGDSNIKIRRPQNAFILYSNRNRADVARQFPGLSNHAVSRLLGTQWSVPLPLPRTFSTTTGSKQSQLLEQGMRTE